MAVNEQVNTAFLYAFKEFVPDAGTSPNDNLTFLFIYQYKGFFVSSRKSVSKANYERIKKLVKKRWKGPKDLDDIGRDFDVHFLPLDIKSQIKALYRDSMEMVNGTKTLKIITNDLSIPWELIQVFDKNDWFYCALKVNVVVSGLFNTARRGNKERPSDAMQFVIFASTDFTEKNTGVLPYIDYIEKLQGTHGGSGKKICLIENFRKQNKDVDILKELWTKIEEKRDLLLLFFTSHLKFDESNPLQSKIQVKRKDANEEVELATILDNMSRVEKYPEILFLNACESSKSDTIYDSTNKKSIFDALFSSGIKYFIGTQWEIESISSHFFSSKFIKTFAERKLNLQNAISVARNVTKSYFDNLHATCKERVEHLQEEHVKLGKQLDKELEQMRVFAQCDRTRHIGPKGKKEQYPLKSEYYKGYLDSIPADLFQRRDVPSPFTRLKAGIKLYKDIESLLLSFQMRRIIWGSYRLISPDDTLLVFDKDIVPVLNFYVPPEFKEMEGPFKAHRVSSRIFSEVNLLTNWTGTFNKKVFEMEFQNGLTVAIMPFFQFLDFRSQPLRSSHSYKIVGEIWDDKDVELKYAYFSQSEEKDGWNTQIQRVPRGMKHPVFFYPKDDYFGVVMYRYFISLKFMKIDMFNPLRLENYFDEYESLTQEKLNTIIEKPDFQGIITRVNSDAYALLKANNLVEKRISDGFESIFLPRYVIVLQDRLDHAIDEAYIQESIDILQALVPTVKKGLKVDENLYLQQQITAQYVSYLNSISKTIQDPFYFIKKDYKIERLDLAEDYRFVKQYSYDMPDEEEEKRWRKTSEGMIEDLDAFKKAIQAYLSPPRP